VPERRRLGAAIAPRQAARHLRAAAGLPEVDGLLVQGVEEGGAADRLTTCTARSTARPTRSSSPSCVRSRRSPSRSVSPADRARCWGGASVGHARGMTGHRRLLNHAPCQSNA
jgi:hypothetical protein